MSYLLQSLDDPERLIISDDEWIYLLESARNSGWSPEGTVYDFWQQIDYYCDDVYYLRKSLEGVCRNLDVFNFLDKGSFRIVKD